VARNLIDSDLSHVLAFDPPVFAAPISVLEVLDEIPADPQMLRHVPDGHPLGQLPHIPRAGVRITATRVGESDGHLPHLPTVRTTHPRDLQPDLDGAGPDGKTAKMTHLASPADHPPGAACRAAKISSFLTEGEDHLAALIRGLETRIAANPKPMIQ